MWAGNSWCVTLCTREINKSQLASYLIPILPIMKPYRYIVISTVQIQNKVLFYFIWGHKFLFWNNIKVHFMSFLHKASALLLPSCESGPSSSRWYLIWFHIHHNSTTKHNNLPTNNIKKPGKGQKISSRSFTEQEINIPFLILTWWNKVIREGYPRNISKNSCFICIYPYWQNMDTWYC